MQCYEERIWNSLQRMLCNTSLGFFSSHLCSVCVSAPSQCSSGAEVGKHLAGTAEECAHGLSSELACESQLVLLRAREQCCSHCLQQNVTNWKGLLRLHSNHSQSSFTTCLAQYLPQIFQMEMRCRAVFQQFSFTQFQFWCQLKFFICLFVCLF